MLNKKLKELQRKKKGVKDLIGVTKIQAANIRDSQTSRERLLALGYQNALNKIIRYAERLR